MKTPRPLSAQGRIRAFVKSNPGATTAEICAAVDVTSKDVSNFNYKSKQSVDLLPAIEDRGIPIIRHEVIMLHREVDNLKHQIVGYQAVISYLENQLGMKSTSHGSPV
jgi:hypothetical protein